MGDYDFDAPMYADLRAVGKTMMSPGTKGWFGARSSLRADLTAADGTWRTASCAAPAPSDVPAWPLAA